MHPRALFLLMAICTGPARAQDTARVFAPGILSTGNVYRGSFTPDGRTLYFFKKVGADTTEDYRIFRSHLIDGNWSQPDTVVLGAAGHSDLYPEVSANGDRMVFTSYRRAPGDTSAHPNASIWYVDRAGAGWGEPHCIASVNLPGYYHAQPSLRGDDLIFNRISPDWRSKGQFIASWSGEAYGPATPFAPWERLKDWNAGGSMEEAIPAPDGSFVLMVVTPWNRLVRRADIWVSFRRDTGWSIPSELIAGVNTAGTENFPFFSPDGRTLYFVRDFNAFMQVDLKAALGEW